jgi:hypothetical protein
MQPRGGTHGKHRLLLLKSVFIALLPSNRRHIVVCACVAGMCLPNRCLAMRMHVTRFYDTMTVGEIR